MMMRCYDAVVRITLDIDDRVLAAAKALAADTHVSVGAALSALARRGLTGSSPARVENGIPVFSPADGARPITLDLVNDHRDG